MDHWLPCIPATRRGGFTPTKRPYRMRTAATGWARRSQVVNLIVAESERRLSRHIQYKGIFLLQRILCTRRCKSPKTAFVTHGI
jgi:hypothetical protein